MFLQPTLSELDNHMIYSKWRLMSDYALLTVNIAIFEKHIQTKTHTIVKNSKEEKNFLTELINFVKSLNIEHISSKKSLEQVVQVIQTKFGSITQKLLISPNTQNCNEIRNIKEN